jgi:hypothetical protein
MPAPITTPWCCWAAASFMAAKIKSNPVIARISPSAQTTLLGESCPIEAETQPILQTALFPILGRSMPRAAKCRRRCAVECPLSGVERTWSVAVQMFANDPERTFGAEGTALGFFSTCNYFASCAARNASISFFLSCGVSLLILPLNVNGIW